MLGCGALLTLSVALITLFVGHHALRIPFDDLMGLMSGVQTQASWMAYAGSMASPSDAPHHAYAAVYPAVMITKIVVAQLLVTGLGG